jgi:hypothetical protein
MMIDRFMVWNTIVAALSEIGDAVEVIEGFELNATDLQAQLEIIKSAQQKVRSAAHGYIRPDLPEQPK